MTPMGRIGQPSEIAPAVLLLASEGASYITGQVIAIDGGGRHNRLLIATLSEQIETNKISFAY